ncbi:MAG: DUF192 domain-containing protein [Proteobacteria bacterium]|nr:DUF192 domain-containing protein [Pseudomonadota bacterium]
MKLGAIFLDNRCVVPRVWNAGNAWERGRGLLGRPPLTEGEGLLISPCRMVHTVGMGYNLDLAFLDRGGKVRKLVSGLRPTRIAGSLPAYATLELAPGTLAQTGLKKGDQLTWRETSL